MVFPLGQLAFVKIRSGRSEKGGSLHLPDQKAAENIHLIPHLSNHPSLDLKGGRVLNRGPFLVGEATGQNRYPSVEILLPEIAISGRELYMNRGEEGQFFYYLVISVSYEFDMGENRAILKHRDPAGSLTR